MIDKVMEAVVETMQGISVQLRTSVHVRQIKDTTTADSVHMQTTSEVLSFLLTKNVPCLTPFPY